MLPIGRRMSDRTAIQSIYYFDLIAVLLTALWLIGGFEVRELPPPVFRDVVGFWLPLLALLLLVAFRRRAYRQVTPWIVLVFGAAFLLASAVISWRWHIVAFVFAMPVVAMLLVAGLALRTRRVSEPISRNDVFGLIAALIALVLTVALCEPLLRVGSNLLNAETQQILRGADPANFGVAHPYIGHLHTPNKTFVLVGRDFEAVHHVDPLGFRNTSPWPEQADVVAIGDSVTFGQCVADEEAWPYLVRRAIAPRRLINLGLIGAGPEEYLRVFETFGVKLRPKLLLVGFFARNDFWDAYQFDRWLQSKMGGNYMVWRDFGRPRPLALSWRDPKQSMENIVRWSVIPVLRRTYLYTLLSALRGTDTAPPRLFHFENGTTLQLFEDEFRRNAAAAQAGRAEFALVLDSLERLRSRAAANDTRMLLLLLPGKEEVYLPLLENGVPDPTAALRAALDERGIEYLDLAPEFRARAAAGEKLFFEVDGHPTKAGQALISELVLAHIKQHADRYGLPN
jgi:hypothetical protein